MNVEALEQASGGTVKQTKYLKNNPVRQFLIQQYLHTISSMAKQVKPSSILDVGCGEGFVIKRLGEALPAAHRSGIDIELGVLKVAAYQNPDAPVAVASAENLPFLPQSYDLVLCNEVLEHVPQPAIVLDEVARIGRKHFIFSVPREPHYRFANMLVGANWSRWGDDVDHCQRWTTTQFVQTLTQKFEVLEVATPFPWTMVLCRKRLT